MDYFHTETKIPVVDFTVPNLSPGTSAWRSAADKVRRGLETYGCVVVSYEKSGSVPPPETLFGLWEGLFGLPVETKMKHTSQRLGFGYGRKYATMPLFECFGIENGATFQAVKDFTSLRWPHGNHNFCQLLVELYEIVMRMTMSSYDYYNSMIESSLYMIRLIRYNSPSNMINNNDNKNNDIYNLPPNTNNDKNNKKNVVGLIAHRDKSFLSIIGSNEVKGLQIQTPNGEWVDFEPSPSKFIVLVGEAFTAWSNGRMYSPLHRVIARGSKERYSIGIFSFICGTLQVPEEFVDDQNPLKFKSFNNFEFLEYCKNGGRTSQSAIQSYCGI